MKRIFFPLLSCLWISTTAQAQEYRIPRDIVSLVGRVQGFWNHMAASQRLKALEFVLPDKRELFLAGGNMPFLQPKVVGIDFTPAADRAVVRISVKLLAKEAPGGFLAWTVTDTWVWKNGWYLDLQDARNENPFQREFGLETRSIDALSRELDSKLRFPKRLLDLGTIPQGVRRKIGIPVEYSGDTPLAIEIKAPGTFLATDAEASGFVTADSKEIGLWLISEAWEGPFTLPVSLLIRYQDVTLERHVSITGRIFALVSFRQEPSPFKNAAGQELRISVHNATPQTISVISASTDDKFEVLELPAAIPPSADGIIRLASKSEKADLPDRVYIHFADSIGGRRVFDVPLRLLPANP